MKYTITGFCPTETGCKLSQCFKASEPERSLAHVNEEALEQAIEHQEGNAVTLTCGCSFTQEI